MMQKKHIAFFDSGVGGLSVLIQAFRLLPYENYIYYADTDNVPYGTKSNQEIKLLVKEAVNFLTEQNLKALVIACNTATSVVVKDLRQTYNFPIIGMEPAVKPAAELESEMRVMVCATDKTIEEDKLKHLIFNLKVEDRVDLMSLQKLVAAAENFDFNSYSTRSYIEKNLGKVDWSKYNALVLGCTHFLFFKTLFRSMIPDHVSIIDGNEGTVRRLASVIENLSEEIDKNTLLKNNLTELSDAYAGVRYYRSGREVPPIYYDNYLRLLDEINS